MKISVIVPAFNEEKLLGATLRSITAALPAFTERGWAHELIVCDNNSTDRTAALAAEAGARVVFEPVNQIARARNAGAAAATGDWLIFVDADSQPTRELFADAAAQIVSGRCLAGGSLLTIDTATVRPWVRRSLHLWNWISRARRLLAGSFIFIEAGVFRELSGFNQELFVYEEIDLSRRLHRLARRRGKEIIILHQHPLFTSNRKLTLYSSGEYLRFLLRLLCTGRASFKRREHCPMWYDGRR